MEVVRKTKETRRALDIEWWKGESLEYCLAKTEEVQQTVNELVLFQLERTEIELEIGYGIVWLTLCKDTRVMDVEYVLTVTRLAININIFDTPDIIYLPNIPTLTVVGNSSDFVNKKIGGFLMSIHVSDLEFEEEKAFRNLTVEHIPYYVISRGFFQNCHVERVYETERGKNLFYLHDSLFSGLNKFIADNNTISSILIKVNCDLCNSSSSKLLDYLFVGLKDLYKNCNKETDIEVVLETVLYNDYECISDRLSILFSLPKCIKIGLVVKLIPFLPGTTPGYVNILKEIDKLGKKGITVDVFGGRG